VQLTQLTELGLGYNQLEELPPEIGQLIQLTELYLYENKLAELPPQIGQLIQLSSLDLTNNQLTVLPPEIGKLVNLEEPSDDAGLQLENNPLESPPPEIVNQGTKAILAYLQAQLHEMEKKPTTHGFETKRLSRFEIIVGIATIIAAIAAVLTLFI